jgi:cytochrome c oxidase subunit 3
MAVQTSARVGGPHTPVAMVPAPAHDPRSDYLHRLRNNRLGLWLFIISDSFIFAGLLVSRFYLLGNHRPHLDQNLGLIVTSVLLISSFCMNRAETMIAHGDRQGFLKNTLITMLLGIAFLIGVVGLEWRIAPFGPGDSVVGAIFYMMTGMHAFHVLTGVVFLFIIYRNGRRGLYSAERHWAVEACANYWHFVDVVWIFFYPALYLIGTVIE